MSISTGALWQTRFPQKNNLTSVKRQVINFMMQNLNTGKWRENNSAVSNSARPHPSTQPPKKLLFMHLKDFLLSWLLLFPSAATFQVRKADSLLYDLWLIKSWWVRDGQMWIRYVCGLDQVTCLTPETSNSSPAKTKTKQFKSRLAMWKSSHYKCVELENLK